MRRSHFSILAAPLILTLLVSACGSDPVGPKEPEEVNFSPSLGVNLADMTRTNSGLYYKVLEEGSGTTVSATGDDVIYQITMQLADGRVLANELTGTTTLGGAGISPLILGVDEGLTGMKVGERRQLVIPWYLAYGAPPYGQVPAYATLVARVQMLDISPDE